MPNDFTKNKLIYLIHQNSYYLHVYLAKIHMQGCVLKVRLRFLPDEQHRSIQTEVTWHCPKLLSVIYQSENTATSMVKSNLHTAKNELGGGGGEAGGSGVKKEMEGLGWC